MISKHLNFMYLAKSKFRSKYTKYYIFFYYHIKIYESVYSFHLLIRKVIFLLVCKSMFLSVQCVVGNKCDAEWSIDVFVR